MNEYQEQALEFLERCNATIKITFSHIGTNENWEDEQLREIYNFTITTPRGSYSSKFYDSIFNLKRKKVIRKSLENTFISGEEKDILKNEYAKLHPNEYDILTCIEKYDPYTFEDFCANYGYDESSKNAKRIYFECKKQYRRLSEIFTPEQMELLREIN